MARSKTPSCPRIRGALAEGESGWTCLLHWVLAVNLLTEAIQRYGFVWFKDPAAVEAAIRETDSTFWHGRRIYVSKRASKRAVSSTRVPSTCLFIGNIPYETTDADLNRLFGSIQGVVDVRVAVDRTTGWPRGFAHADFADVEAAEAARTKLSDQEFNGRQLRVDFAEAPKVRRRSSNDDSQV